MITDAEPSDDPYLLRGLITEGQLSDRSLAIRLAARTLAVALQIDATDLDSQVLHLDLPLTIRRRGV